MSTEEDPFLTSPLGSYQPPIGVYDEMILAPGQPRPHCHSFLKRFTSLSSNEISRRYHQAQHHVRENGATFNVYKCEEEKVRPWQLDLIPLLFSQEEWGFVSKALIQRAELLNLIIADLYGPMRLLKEKLLPPEVLFGHPHFHRSFSSIKRDKGSLQLYGAELARSPSGDFWVMADRTSWPAGSGYALENRIVVSRMLSEIIHNCWVERLAPFFMALQERMLYLVPRLREHPHIVYLTQGPSYRYYFEDAFLARYLGYTLAEGGDLAVRDNCVYLKTYRGLVPVDVLLYSGSENDCDPLELGGFASIGVPGLVQAIRCGNVATANTFGSGIVESPLFMAFLPNLCRFFLGQDLILPSVATWWCGQPHALNYVLNNIDHLVIKPAFSYSGSLEMVVDQLNKEGKERLIAHIKARPSRFLAQEKVERSSAPQWNEERTVASSHIALRTFLVANGSTFRVMQGALARTAPSTAPLELTISAGSGSKDTWVLSNKPVEAISLLQTNKKSITLHRGTNVLQSRVADNLFWMGRMLARAENMTRLMRAVIERLLEESLSNSIIELPVLLKMLADQKQIDETFFQIEGERLERQLSLSVFAEENPFSLKSCVNSIYRQGLIVRERISQDHWQILHYMKEEFIQSSAVPTLSEVYEACDRLLVYLIACRGLAAEGMTYTAPWQFLSVGRHLESSLQIAQLLSSSLGKSCQGEYSLLGLVLRISDSSMTYRSRYLSAFHPAAVVDLLVNDESNPHSLARHLCSLYKIIEQLPKDSEGLLSEQERTAMSIYYKVRLTNPKEIMNTDGQQNRPALLLLLKGVEEDLEKLANQMTRKYFVHAETPRQMVSGYTQRM